MNKYLANDIANALKTFRAGASIDKKASRKQVRLSDEFLFFFIPTLLFFTNPV